MKILSQSFHKQFLVRNIHKNFLKNFSSGLGVDMNINEERPKLRIRKPLENYEAINFDIPYVEFRKPLNNGVPQYKTILLKSRLMRHSCYKLNFFFKMIRGKYLQTALDISKTQPTKAASMFREFATKFLENNLDARRKKHTHIEKDDRFVDYKILEAYVGKAQGHSLPNFRGKGKADTIIRSLCRLNLRLEKVYANKFYQEAAEGKTCLSHAHKMRQHLFSSNSTLKDLKKFSFITTSQGRYYRKQQLKRLIIHLRNKYNEEKGIKLSTSLIENYVKKNLGKRLFQVTPQRMKIVEKKWNEINRLNLEKEKLDPDFFNTFLLGDEKEIAISSQQSREEQYAKKFKKI